MTTKTRSYFKYLGLYIQLHWIGYNCFYSFFQWPVQAGTTESCVPQPSAAEEYFLYNERCFLCQTILSCACLPDGHFSRGEQYSSIQKIKQYFLQPLSSPTYSVSPLNTLNITRNYLLSEDFDVFSVFLRVWRNGSP